MSKGTVIRTIYAKGAKYASLADLARHFRDEQESWRKVADEATTVSTEQTIANSRAKGYGEVVDALLRLS